MNTRKLIPLILFLLVIISCNKKGSDLSPETENVVNELTVNSLRYTGTVLDANDHTVLPGVAVFRKFTNTGTVTDADGKFTYTSTVYDNFTMVFKLTGYETKELPVGPGGSDLGGIELVPEP